MLVSSGKLSGTTLIVVLLVRQTLLADYAPTQAVDSAQYRSRDSARGGCVALPSNMTLCHDVGYQDVRLPNVFGHITMNEVARYADNWVLLVNIHCHADTQVNSLFLWGDGE